MPVGHNGPQMTAPAKRNFRRDRPRRNVRGSPVSSSIGHHRGLLAQCPVPDQHVARMTEPHFLKSARAQIGRDRRAGAQSCQMRPAHFLLQHLTGAKRRIALGFLGFFATCWHSKVGLSPTAAACRSSGRRWRARPARPRGAARSAGPARRRRRGGPPFASRAGAGPKTGSAKLRDISPPCGGRCRCRRA